jgi:hypothetical protein
MTLPFGTDQFLEVFRGYHAALPAAPWFLNLLGVALVAWAIRPGRSSARWIVLGLGVLWLWTGVVYHLVFFTRINRAAFLFGALFVVQGLLLVRFALTSPDLTTRVRANPSGIAGAALVGYAWAVYPVLATIFGHRYPAMPTFGLPCPTTIFTLGVMLWIRPHVPWHLLVIPAGWAVLGMSAAVALGMREDFGLVVSALIALPLLLSVGTGRRSGRSASRRMTSRPAA